jgi:hypothetical protein
MRIGDTFSPTKFNANLMKNADTGDQYLVLTLEGHSMENGEEKEITLLFKRSEVGKLATFFTEIEWGTL